MMRRHCPIPRLWTCSKKVSPWWCKTRCSATFRSSVTLEEVNSQIALEYGQAMTVRVCKMDGEVMPVVVVQNATVLDLKKAIQRYVQLKQEREGGVQHISWSYVWRTYHLTSSGEKLTEDRKKLRDYGIRNRDEVSFIKKLRQK
ncbi:U11/U12 small nuclear ribonucleoprotein 25 kDa protein [Apodemus speciosus]|uniref:U11/U12 small nuclear ribonucleoprotein 25 kDa protein n=1 Tax=Apodemus speciosus TaxID=105296 RepID=A0ABQ0F9G1_APOSI